MALITQYVAWLPFILAGSVGFGRVIWFDRVIVALVTGNAPVGVMLDAEFTPVAVTSLGEIIDASNVFPPEPLPEKV